jgi:hypothetical protein
VKNNRYTLAVRRVTNGDTASSVLAEFLGLVDDFDFNVKAVYVDREFYDGKCLTLMQAHNHAYVMPIIKWGTKIQNALSEGWSREIEHELTTEFDGHEWTVEFPVMIDCTYQQSRYDEHRVAHHGYAVDAPFIDTPRQARQTSHLTTGSPGRYRPGKSDARVATLSASATISRRLDNNHRSLCGQNNTRRLSSPSTAVVCGCGCVFSTELCEILSITRLYR